MAINLFIIENKKRLTVLMIFFLMVVAFFINFSIVESEKKIISGDNFFPSGLIIHKGEVLVIKPGSVLRFGKDSRLVVKGKIIAEGKEGKPIIFKGEGDYWRGLIIEGSDDSPILDSFWRWLSEGNKNGYTVFRDKISKGNIFNYCHFENISIPSREFSIGNKWKAAIESYSSSLRIENSIFNDILHIGGVLVQRSYLFAGKNELSSDLLHKDFNGTDSSVGIIYKNKITHKRDAPQRCADGIWLKDSSFLISENIIHGNADDSIDADNSLVVISGNDIKNSLDDGIDIDSESFAYLFRNSIENVNENGFLISDNSKAILSENSIKDSAKGLTIRNGARVFSSEANIKNNEYGIYIFQDFPCALSDEDFKLVLGKISRMTDDEIYLKKIDGVSKVEQLLESLKENYKKEGDGFWYLVKSDSSLGDFKLLRELFKLVDDLNMNYVFNDKTNNKTCLSMKNSLYLLNSEFDKNKEDIYVEHKNSINIEGTVFSSDSMEKNAMNMVDKNFSCSLVDKINTEAVRINVEDIVSLFK